MLLSAKIKPIDSIATKNVFISAIRFAMSIEENCPVLENELKISAREQIEYMLEADEETQLITLDDDVKSAVRLGLSTVFTSFQDSLSMLLLKTGLAFESAEEKVLESLSDIEWMCNVLPKLDVMKDLVSKWIDESSKFLEIIEHEDLDSRVWGLKVKLVEVTGKALDSLGYGNVILPSKSRVHLIKSWLPFIRKLKPLLDSKGLEDSGFCYKMDEDFCQSIEGSMVSLVLGLPSNDQAEVLGEWVRGVETQHVRFPDLSEAFEVWCYRSKSAKRRLLERCDRLVNGSLCN